MNKIKNIIVVAVLVASAAQALPQSSWDARNIRERCEYAATELPKDGMMDSQDALTFLKGNFRYAYEANFNKDVYQAWDHMLKNECTEDSLKAMSFMNQCKASFPEAIIAQPLKAFADKCLNSEQVYKRVKDMSAWMHRQVSSTLIDADFVADYRKSHPEAGPLNFNTKTLEASKAVDTIVEAFKREFVRSGKDAKARNVYNQYGLKIDINDMLIIACEKNAMAGINIAKEIEAVGDLREGGVEALIASLKPEAQTVLFRYTFCANIYEKSLADKRTLVKKVEAQLL